MAGPAKAKHKILVRPPRTPRHNRIPSSSKRGQSCAHAANRRGRRGSSPFRACTAAKALTGRPGSNGSSRARCASNRRLGRTRSRALGAIGARVARPRTRPVRARRTQLRLPRGRACARAVAAYGRRRGRAARRARQSEEIHVCRAVRRAPAPRASIVIGSETDPWMPLGDARTLAQHLGSAFVNLGDAGHINTAAGFAGRARSTSSTRSSIARHRCAFATRTTASKPRCRPRARARGSTGGRRGAHARRLSRHRAPLHLRRTHGLTPAGAESLGRPGRRGPRGGATPCRLSHRRP